MGGCWRAAAPTPRQGQQSRKVPLVGFLNLPSRPASLSEYPFSQGLRELGYVDGANIRIEWRFLDNELDRAVEVAGELVRLEVDVLVVEADGMAVAARAQTSTIPIVFTLAEDPVGNGLVASLARPGGNVTGLTRGAGLSPKRLELLKEAVPGLSRVGAVWDPRTPGQTQDLSDIQAGASALGIQAHSLEVRSLDDFESALREANSAGDQGLVMLAIAVPITAADTRRLVEAVTGSRLPVMYVNPGIARAGGLISYGVDIDALRRRAAGYVDKILKGAKPADLPVEGPTKFDLVINLAAAKAIDLTLPATLLSQATEVIQ